MNKTHHFIISYNTFRKEWELDIDAEETHFPDGTIYDYDSEQWNRDYDGDGEFLEIVFGAGHVRSLQGWARQDRAAGCARCSSCGSVRGVRAKARDRRSSRRI